MILKASQRGGGKQLALHLLRRDENEHVEVHEVRGFVSEDLVGAFQEAYAISKGTKCKQFLFSVSLNPPPQERVEIATFEDAIARIEESNGLTGQPRAIVFHEKEGRRHAHAVWSRIDADTMTAKNLPFFKNKLRDLSRELYLENGWKMPRGLMNSREADPRNFTLAEWHQAKRAGRDARDLKSLLQECWAVSDSPAAFSQALKNRGFTLARGDRRGHVAISPEGEVFSVSRAVGKKSKEVALRLGTPDNLPSVADARGSLAGEAVATEPALFAGVGHITNGTNGQRLLEAVRGCAYFRRHRKRVAPRMRGEENERMLATELLVRMLYAIDLRGIHLAEAEKQALVVDGFINGLATLRPRDPMQRLADIIPGARPHAHPESRLYDEYRRYLLKLHLGRNPNCPKVPSIDDLDAVA